MTSQPSPNASNGGSNAVAKKAPLKPFGFQPGDHLLSETDRDELLKSVIRRWPDIIGGQRSFTATEIVDWQKLDHVSANGEFHERLTGFVFNLLSTQNKPGFREEELREQVLLIGRMLVIFSICNDLPADMSAKLAAILQNIVNPWLPGEDLSWMKPAKEPFDMASEKLFAVLEVAQQRSKAIATLQGDFSALSDNILRLYRHTKDDLEGKECHLSESQNGYAPGVLKLALSLWFEASSVRRCEETFQLLQGFLPPHKTIEKFINSLGKDYDDLVKFWTDFSLAAIRISMFA